jgi:hypothetical protein
LGLLFLVFLFLFLFSRFFNLFSYFETFTFFGALGGDLGPSLLPPNNWRATPAAWRRSSSALWILCLTRGLTFPTLLLLELLYLPFLLRPGPFRLNTLTRGDDGLLILTESSSDGSRMVNIPWHFIGFLGGSNHTSIVRDGHEQATIHAEISAITDAAKRGVSIDGTRYLCWNS